MTTATDEPTPESPSPFERIGGEPGVRALVDRFYDLMDLEPGYAALRGVHGPDLHSARDKLYWFLCGWLGGPDHFVQRFGHPRLRARHLPFSIGHVERDQWLACMFQAMHECEVERPLAARLEKSFTDTADWMVNAHPPARKLF
jgi:hemoglobin